MGGSVWLEHRDRMLTEAWQAHESQITKDLECQTKELGLDPVDSGELLNDLRESYSIRNGLQEGLLPSHIEGQREQQRSYSGKDIEGQTRSYTRSGDVQERLESCCDRIWKTGPRKGGEE